MRIALLILAITVSISSSAQRDTLHFVVSRPTEKNTELYAGQLIMLGQVCQALLRPLAFDGIQK